jgi:uncharacterized protein YlaN (UPF0358 family)
MSCQLIQNTRKSKKKQKYWLKLSKEEIQLIKVQITQKQCPLYNHHQKW